MYQFNSKRLFVLLMCVLALVVVTFTAGVVTGLGIAMPTREEIALLKSAHAPKLAVAGEPPHPPAAIPAVAVPTLAVPTVAVAAAAAIPAQPPAEPAKTETPEQTVAAAPAPTPAPAARIAPAAAPEPNENFFALQLGSFRDLNHAKELQTEMKDRGYVASIMTALDSDQREWHVVRIEGFKTLASASQAAQELINKERVPAVVRRSKSL